MEKSSSKTVQEHKEVRHLTEIVIYPDHAERKESAEFRQAKERLKEDGHYKCWVCGTTDHIQVHHMAEWAFANDIDFNKLKAFIEEWDIYGYGRLLKNQPLTTVDDIRCLICLCQEHHTGGLTDGVANGIHQISFPAWLVQKLAKTGAGPVPDDEKELERELTAK